MHLCRRGVLIREVFSLEIIREVSSLERCTFFKGVLLTWDLKVCSTLRGVLIREVPSLERHPPLGGCLLTWSLADVSSLERYPLFLSEGCLLT